MYITKVVNILEGETPIFSLSTSIYAINIEVQQSLQQSDQNLNKLVLHFFSLFNQPSEIGHLKIFLVMTTFIIFMHIILLLNQVYASAKIFGISFLAQKVSFSDPLLSVVCLSVSLSVCLSVCHCWSLSVAYMFHWIVGRGCALNHSYMYVWLSVPFYLFIFW